MSVTASCGHVLKDGEETIPVRIGGEDCDGAYGFSACVEYSSFCPSCAEKARSWETYLPDDVGDDWWFEVGYPQWMARGREL